MMTRGKLISDYKDDIQALAALTGVLSVLLYVFGYVAERVHWNLLGIIQVPANHIEFLYRGGNVIISSLVSILLYPVLALAEPTRRTPLLVIVIVTMLVVTFVRSRNLTIYRSYKLNHPRDTLRLCFVLLLTLSIWELTAWPDSSINLLFEAPRTNSAPGDPVAFFQGYVGLMALWFLFYLVCRRTQRRAALIASKTQNTDAASQTDAELKDSDPSASAFFVLATKWGWIATATGVTERPDADGGELTDAAQVPTPIVAPWLRRVALVFGLVLFIALPLVYGSFRFPNTYPVVRVLLASKASINWKDCGSSLLEDGDLKDPSTLASKVQNGQDPLSQYLKMKMTPAFQSELVKHTNSGPLSEALRNALMDELNTLLKGPALFSKERFAHVDLTGETRSLSEQELKGEELIRFNRMLLVEAYPHEIAKERQCFGPEGNPMALLYETGEDYVFYRKTPQPTVMQLKKSEVGGLIVYQSMDITAATLEAR